MIRTGGKFHTAKRIIPIMLSEREPGQAWVEPFVGGGSVICRVDGERIGSDLCPHVIGALTLIRDRPGELPKNNSEYTTEDHQRLREGGDHEFRDFCGLAYSFYGRWLEVFQRCNHGRDYVRQAYDSAQRQSPGLQGVKLVHCDYRDLGIPPRSLIYCDPPYGNTVNKYRNVSDGFDNAAFWDWCRARVADGHTVFVSEYEAPIDFELVWEARAPTGLASCKGKGLKRIEKLFRLNAEKGG